MKASLPSSPPTRIRLKLKRQGKLGWFLPLLIFVALLWTVGTAASPSGAAAWGVGLLLTVMYTLVGFSGARALGWRSGGLLLAAWIGAGDQVHRALNGATNAGVLPWLLFTGAAWLGCVWAIPRVKAAAPQANLSFQMDFEDTDLSKRKIA